MNSNIIELLHTKKKDLPDFKSGDTIKVTSKIFEADTEKTQHFEGIVIKKRSNGLDETFTVRKVSFGVGVERIFHLHSPNITKIELINKGKYRRAKLYYLRDRSYKNTNQ